MLRLSVYRPFSYCIDYRRSERVGPFTRICRPDLCSDRRNQYNMRMVYRVWNLRACSIVTTPESTQVAPGGYFCKTGQWFGISCGKVTLKSSRLQPLVSTPCPGSSWCERFCMLDRREKFIMWEVLYHWRMQDSVLTGCYVVLNDGIR